MNRENPELIYFKPKANNNENDDEDEPLRSSSGKSGLRFWLSEYTVWNLSKKKTILTTRKNFINLQESQQSSIRFIFIF